MDSVIHLSRGQIVMKRIEVAAAIIMKNDRLFATQRGYGDFKDFWEFPGGKIEAGETPEEALVREIREELNAEISVGKMIRKIDYDYPAFHLTMYCFICELISAEITLVEHEAARWLSMEELDEVEWLPPDTEVIDSLKKKGKPLL